MSNKYKIKGEEGGVRTEIHRNYGCLGVFNMQLSCVIYFTHSHLISVGLDSKRRELMCWWNLKT